MAAAGGCLATVTMAVVALTFQSRTAADDSPAAVRLAGTAPAAPMTRTELRAAIRKVRVDFITGPPFGWMHRRAREAHSMRSGLGSFPRAGRDGSPRSPRVTGSGRQRAHGTGLTSAMAHRVAMTAG